MKTIYLIVHNPHREEKYKNDYPAGGPYHYYLQLQADNVPVLTSDPYKAIWFDASDEAETCLQNLRTTEWANNKPLYVEQHGFQAVAKKQRNKVNHGQE